MSDTLLKYQCPACGGTLEFSPSKQLLVCEFCDSEFHEDVLKQKNDEANKTQASDDSSYDSDDSRIDWKVEGFVNKQEVLENQVGFNCTSCGAEVISDGKTAATECMYCGNPIVISNNVSGMVKPDMIIPFKVEKDRAVQMLEEFCKGKPLLPDEFTKNNRISKVAGMYVPFWLFSCNGNGQAKFTAKKVTHWSSGNYDYTKTRVYNVFRRGSLEFEKVPVDASTKMEDNYMDGLEPYHYRDFVDFNTMYMAGYFSQKFDVDVDASIGRANVRITESVRSALRNTVTGYSSVICDHSNINMTGEDIHYALLPIWMLNTKYKGKTYQFAINGQTGRVSGELPVDKGKLFRYRLLITLAGIIPIAGLAYWLFSS